MKANYKYLYGPVNSWRLGRSLGVDLLSQREKTCNFDCVYCQMGKTLNYSNQRKIYVAIEHLVNELNSLPNLDIDYITFAGTGEPSLAENLGFAVSAIIALRKEPYAVITNSSLLSDKSIRHVISSVDFVIAKMDAFSEETFRQINNPSSDLNFETVIDGLINFRKEFKGRLALQIMFLEQNNEHIVEIQSLVKEISPDEIQINTPLRECKIKPLSKRDIISIKNCFLDNLCKAFTDKNIKIISVYDDIKFNKAKSISNIETLRRRGKKNFNPSKIKYQKVILCKK